MAVLTLPVVIVATEEALRAVPRELREASLALGATKFQTVLHVVLPQAAPGILTGTILAVSRGAGEVAPILFTGAAYFLPQLPNHLSSQFMSPSYHVYVLATQSPDVDATKPILYATVLVLLVADLHAQPRGGRRAGPACGAVRGRRREPPTAPAKPEPAPKLTVRDLTVFYGEKKALGPVAMDIVGEARHGAHRPVGLRQVDLPALAEPDERAHPRLPDRRARCSSTAMPIYGPGIDPVAVRRRIGMVFQRSNPFPKSISENVAYGLRIGGISDARDIAARVERALRPGGAVGRGEGPPQRQRARRSRAGSSSASASRARWRSSRRCC